MHIAGMDPTVLDNFELDLGHGSEIGLSVSIAIMMLAVALALKPEHFKSLADRPKVFFSGVVAQLLILPLATIILCWAVKPHPTLALGMIIVACCPGGNVSNLLSMLSRGNTALSVSLTATSSLFAAFLTPVTILFWTSLYEPTASLLKEINLNVFEFLLQTFITLAIPLIIGMLIRRYYPKFADKIHQPLTWIAFALLLLIIVSAFTRYWDLFISIGMPVLGLTILHNGLAFAIGYFTGVFSGADKFSKRSLTIEIGIQNSGLALVILVTALSGFGGAAAIIGLWGTWHIVAGLILVSIFRWQDRGITNV